VARSYKARANGKNILPSVWLAYSRYPTNWAPIRRSSLTIGCQRKTKKENVGMGKYKDIEEGTKRKYR
jgi:hypothetical protein